MVFDWDDANREHIAEHGVTISEAEYALLHDPLDVAVESRDGEERLVQIGATARGRILVIVTTARGMSIRVVTAYDGTRRDRLAYEVWRRDIYGTEA